MPTIPGSYLALNYNQLQFYPTTVILLKQNNFKKPEKSCLKTFRASGEPGWKKVNFSDCNCMQFIVSKNFFRVSEQFFVNSFFSLKAEVRNNWTTERFDEFLSKENFFQTIVKPVSWTSSSVLKWNKAELGLKGPGHTLMHEFG